MADDAVMHGSAGLRFHPVVALPFNQAMMNLKFIRLDVTGTGMLHAILPDVVYPTIPNLHVIDSNHAGRYVQLERSSRFTALASSAPNP